LDFSNPKRSADSLHHSIAHAIASAASGLALRDLKVSEPGKTESSPKWKINFLDSAGQRYHLEVEVSRDPKRAPPGAVVQKPLVPRAAVGIPRFWVDIYDEPTLIATKIAALLGRDTARDVYDLDLLMGTRVSPSKQLVQWAVQRAHLEESDPLAVLQANLQALTWQRYLTELRDSLTESSAERIDVREWQAMKKRVADYVAELLSSL
jgi:predicted nucleotidyltransferase component of viral defense system